MTFFDCVLNVSWVIFLGIALILILIFIVSSLIVHFNFTDANPTLIRVISFVSLVIFWIIFVPSLIWYLNENPIKLKPWFGALEKKQHIPPQAESQ